MKRKTKQKVGPLLNRADDLVRRDMDNVFFIFVFTGKSCLQESQISDTIGEVLSKEDDENQIRE